jgi:hypothetical protein
MDGQMAVTSITFNICDGKHGSYSVMNASNFRSC